MMMNLISRIAAVTLALLADSAAAFSVQRQPNDATMNGAIDRRDAFLGIASVVFGAASFASPASADVSDGNALPQAAAQFQRVIRLQADLKKIKKRVEDGASDIDRAEWENVSQFLRLAYSTGDDMKAVAGGIYNPDNKKRALQDIEQLRKYAQAGDIAVTKRDGPGFVGVADKMSFLVSDFLDSLSDVPDEI